MTPVPATAPAHLFGLEMFHLGFGRERGTRILIRWRQLSVFCKRMRHQRRGLRTCSKRGRAGGKSSGDLQKVSAFHDISLLVLGE